MATKKLICEFIIDGFDIYAEVDFVNFYTNSRQKFKVSRKNVESWENKKSLIVFDVHKGQIMLEDDRRLVELGALKKYMKKYQTRFQQTVLIRISII